MFGTSSEPFFFDRQRQMLSSTAKKRNDTRMTKSLEYEHSEANKEDSGIDGDENGSLVSKRETDDLLAESASFESEEIPTHADDDGGVVGGVVGVVDCSLNPFLPGSAAEERKSYGARRDATPIPSPELPQIFPSKLRKGLGSALQP